MDKKNVPQFDNRVNYHTTDSDLPGFFWSRVRTARERIQITAAEMGIDITTEEAAKFALVFLGIEDDGEA